MTDRLLSRTSRLAAAAVLIVVVMTTVVVGVGTSSSAAPAGRAPVTCVTVANGLYLGTYQQTSPGAWTGSQFTGFYGATTFDVTVTGTTISGTTDWVSGRSPLAVGVPFTGTISCNTVDMMVGDIAHVTGQILPDSSFVLTWVHSPVPYGTMVAAPILSSVSTQSDTSLTTGSGVSLSNPIQVSVASPNPGTLSISTAVAQAATLPGQNLVAPLVGIEAPRATVDAPLTITMTLDQSLLAGQPPSSFFVSEGGRQAAQWCPPGGAPLDVTADPCEVDPPVVDPTTGAVTFTVLSSQASVWGVGHACNLAIENFGLPPATVGKPYSAAISGCGGTPPYAFSTASSLPSGLTLSSDGLISGTPTTAGTSRIKVLLQDSLGVSLPKLKGHHVKRSYPLKVR